MLISERDSSECQNHVKEDFTEYFLRKVFVLLMKKRSSVLVSGCVEENGGLQAAKGLLLPSMEARENIESLEYGHLQYMYLTHTIHVMNEKLG